MGSSPSSLTYHRVPNAIVVFGTNPGPGSEKLYGTIMCTLQNVCAEINTAIGQGYLDFLSPAKPFLECVTTCFSAINKLIDESDKLHNSLEKLEHDIYSVLLDGKLKALKNHSNTLRDMSVSREQRIAELVSAVSHFHEILPLFTNETSILSRKCFLGAQIFVPICGIFKLIVIVCENTKGYNSPGLSTLKEQYRSAMESFQARCIRSRLQSVHLITAGGPMYTRLYFEEDLLKFSPYFDGKFEKEDTLGYCGRSKSIFLEAMPMLVDPWDPREKQEINFETVTLIKEKGLNLTDDNLWRKALHTYRTNVKNTLEQYFAAVMP